MSLKSFAFSTQFDMERLLIRNCTLSRIWSGGASLFSFSGGEFTARPSPGPNTAFLGLGGANSILPPPSRGAEVLPAVLPTNPPILLLGTDISPPRTLPTLLSVIPDAPVGAVGPVEMDPAL